MDVSMEVVFADSCVLTILSPRGPLSQTRDVNHVDEDVSN